MENKHVDRRGFLKLSSIGVGGLALTACGIFNNPQTAKIEKTNECLDQVNITCANAKPGLETVECIARQTEKCF